MLDIVLKTIKEIQNLYPTLYVSYDYLEEEDIYEIWHNSIDLRNNLDFQNNIGKIIEKNLYNNDLYNVFVDYNEEKTNNYEFYEKYFKNFEIIANIWDLNVDGMLDVIIEPITANVKLNEGLNYKRGKIESCNQDYALAA